MSAGPSPSFGSLLQRYRREAGMTQEALAERALMSRRGIQKLEQGTSRAPRRDTVDLLAEALGLSKQQQADLLTAAGRQPLAPESPAAPVHVALPFSRSLSPLIGREAELAILEQFLAGEADLGEDVPLLLLAGEPGIGKTRLLEAAAQRAITRGWCVLAGGCQRRGGQEPYAPLLEALARHLQTQAPAVRATELAGCAWLARLLPELAEVLEPLPAAELPAEQERRLLFAAVARFLANVAGPAGTVLVLDDLQWAGSDALDLLASLVRLAESGDAGGGRLRVVGGYRDTEVGPTHPLGLLLADLASAGLVRQQSVSPLGTDEATALLAHLLVGMTHDDPSVIPRVLERAGGTPFFLVSYALALKLGSTEAVPWDLSQGVRQRLALAPAARDLLGAAAIIGRRVPRALLEAVVDQPDEALLAGLEAACGARLLLEEGEDAYVFAHDVIREVIEADLGAGRRAHLHRRVAEALEGASPPAPPERLAYHYGRAGIQDKVVEYLARAGDHASTQYAFSSAEARYRELVELLERLGRPQEALEARGPLSEALRQLGRYQGAIEVLEPVAEAYRAAGDWERLAEAVARIGWLHSLRGTPHQGLALIQPLVELLERRGASPVLGALYGALGQLLCNAGQYEASLVANERAAELARASGDALTQALAEYNGMVLLQQLGRLDDAVRRSEEVLSLAEAAGYPNLLLAALRDLAYIHALRGALTLSREAMERARLVARQVEDPGQRGMALAQRGWIAFLAGDWMIARAEMDEAVALGRQAVPSYYAPYPLIFRACLSLAEGDWAAAAARSEEALTLAHEDGDLQAQRRAAGILAELEIREGHPEVASERLEPLLDRPGLEECDVTMLLPVLAWAHLEEGMADQAADEVAQALVRARREDMRLVLVESLRVQGMIALRRRCWPEAAASLEEGLALARELPHPYAEARLLSVDGQRLAAGEPVAARERLEAALAIVKRLGARKDVERIEHALSRLA